MADVNNTNTTPEAKQFLDKAGLDALVNQIKINFSTKDELNNKDFYDIVNNPIVNTSTDKFVVADKQGNIGLRLDVDSNLYVNDVVAGNDVLSNKADKDEIPSLEGYATEEFVTDTINNLDFKTINGNSILGNGDISIPNEIELITISGDMLADEPIYTATEAQSIIDAYNASKLIAIKCGTRINFGKGWFIPNINIRTQSSGSQIFLSGILGNYYIEHRIVFDTSAGTVSTIAMSFIDLSNVGSGDSGDSCSCNYPDANVQSVDTGDIVDDVEVEYATKSYVDGLIGDINSILERLINNQ